jgi:hypothetical protein
LIVPLIVETEMLVAAAYLIGIGIGWLIFRPKRETFL